MQFDLTLGLYYKLGNYSSYTYDDVDDPMVYEADQVDDIEEEEGSWPFGFWK